MLMRRVEDTADGAAHEKTALTWQKVSVGEFRAFVNQTGYLTDCEKQAGGWIYSPRKQWIRMPDASWDNPYMLQEDNDPVVLVSWYDAVTFANWKSVRDGLSEAYRVAKAEPRRMVEWDRRADGYRLPTANEWETLTATTKYRVGAAPGRRKRANVIAAALPSSITCEGVVNGHQLEWCWDHSAGGLTDTRVEPLSPATAPESCRRVIVNADGERVGPNWSGVCHPLTAVTTLGFRLVRRQT